MDLLDRLGLGFLGCFFPVLSATAAWWLRIGWKRGNASMYWPTTQGDIVQSVVQRDSEARFFPQVQYTYSVAGERFQSDTITYRGHSLDLATAESYTARYPVGSRVTVYYDPDCPAISLLEPGVRRGAYVGGAVVLFVLFAVGIGCAVAALR